MNFKFAPLDIAVVSLLVTIALACTGYWYSLYLSRRQERLNLINKRINEFYGPLYVACQAGVIAHKTLINKLGSKKKLFDPSDPLSEHQMREWYIWVEHVFMPLNEFREKLILDNAYLIREREMPECLLQFVTHVSSYKAMIEKWREENFSEYKPLIEFPIEINSYAASSYDELKEEQIRLIGKK